MSCYRSMTPYGVANECRRGLIRGMGYTEEEFKRPIIAVVNSWNEYFWPLLILRSNELQTITLATKYYSGTEGSTGWGNVMALASISIALPLVLYLFAQRTIISTFMSSGIKE